MARILLVDDDDDGSEAVVRFLARFSHEVEHVPGGAQAIKALTRRKPDAVILDLRMPQMDGLSFLEILRSYLSWRDIPVILRSAHLDPIDVERARALGVRRTFEKAGAPLLAVTKALDELLAAASTQPLQP